jgi:hypothetical protein
VGDVLSAALIADQEMGGGLLQGGFAVMRLGTGAPAVAGIPTLGQQTIFRRVPNSASAPLLSA